MFANFTEETCTGTGDVLTLAGATNGNLPFSASFNDGDSVACAVRDANGVTKVAGIYTFNAAANTFARADAWSWDGTSVDKQPVANIALSGGVHTITCTESISTLKRSITAVVQETSGIIPARPAGYDVVHYYCWEDPQIDAKYPYDQWVQIQEITAPVDKQQIDTLIVVGASIMQGCWSSWGGESTSYDARSQMLNEIGVDLPFYNYAVAGNTLDDGIAQASQAASDFAGKSNVGVLVHIGGNNSNMWPDETAAFSTKLAQIYQTLIDAGFHIIPTPLTFRSDQPYQDDERYYLGINVINPLIESMVPYWWNTSQDQPYLNFYNTMYENRADAFVGGDELHPGPAGRNYLRAAALTAINDRYSVKPFDGQEVITFNLANGSGTTKSLVPNTNFTGNSVTDPINNKGQTVTGTVTVTGIDLAGGSGTGGTADEFNAEPYQSHYFITRAIKWATSPFSFTLNLPEYANRTGILKYTGSRSGSSRSTRITIGADYDVLEGNTVGFAEVPFAFDETGQLVINVQGEADSYAYYSGMSLYLDDAS